MGCRNGIGMAGVSAGVKIMALQFLGTNGSGFIADAARALTYAQGGNIRISNNSWGGGSYAQVFFETFRSLDLRQQKLAAVSRSMRLLKIKEQAVKMLVVFITFYPVMTYWVMTCKLGKKISAI